MQLSEREAALVNAFRRLPPNSAMELSELAERMAEFAASSRLDWSDSWSEEDLNQFRAASLRRLGGDASAYVAAPPMRGEFSCDEEPIVWEGDGWDHLAHKA